jgi:hypothetical protein
MASTARGGLGVPSSLRDEAAMDARHGSAGRAPCRAFAPSVFPSFGSVGIAPVSAQPRGPASRGLSEIAATVPPETPASRPVRSPARLLHRRRARPAEPAPAARSGGHRCRVMGQGDPPVTGRRAGRAQRRSVAPGAAFQRPVIAKSAGGHARVALARDGVVEVLPHRLYRAPCRSCTRTDPCGSSGAIMTDR